MKKLCVPALIAVFACARAYAPPGPAPVPAPATVPTRVPDTNSSPAPVPASRPTEGLIDGGAGSLWYHIVGRGRDTVLVPLGTWLEPGLAPLGEHHTMVFYDPRHRGRSHALTDSLESTFDGDVADLEAIRAAIGASRVSVIGYDYYGAVAAAWAASNPERVSRLVLLSPIEPADSLARTWNPPERMARLDTIAARALVKARDAGRDTTDAASYCTEFWQVNAPVFVGDTAKTGQVRASWCEQPNESPARVALAMERVLSSLGPEVDFGARAGSVSAPTLVMHGRLDLVANPEGAREWTRRISGARLLWLSNVGHLPQLEDSVTVTGAINDFLGGNWPPRAGPP